MAPKPTRPWRALGFCLLLVSFGPVQASAAERFTALLNGEAVKDGRTGLIWEQAPDLDHDVWHRSVERCRTKTVGGKSGWRAPTVDELKTLVDPDERDPSLPKGHPFANIKSAVFWTATPHKTDDILAWHVSFLSGEVVSDQKSGMRRGWCLWDGPATR